MSAHGTSVLFCSACPRCALVGVVGLPAEVCCARYVRGVVNTLAACWHRTRHMPVPQYRDGECEVRRLWDAAVSAALGWDPSPITRLRQLLHEEPHVKKLGYGQYADAPDQPE